MNILKNKNEFYDLLKSEKILIAQFGSASCLPCASIYQKLSLWISENPDVSAAYIPVESFSSLTAQLGVFSVPTIFVYVEGQLTVRESGYFSLDELLSQVERYCSLLS